MRELTLAELQMNIKSLSITFDSLSKKLGRVYGTQREAVKEEYATCDSLLTAYRAEMTRRMNDD